MVGRLLTRAELLRALGTRRHLAAARRAAPAMADEIVAGPVVVTGAARSGTSITFELIGLDERLRTPVAADVLQAAQHGKPPRTWLIKTPA